ncbi:hypothetical protein [Nocardioides zeae]
MTARPPSRGVLLRAGFADVETAGERLVGLGEPAGALLGILGRTADPDAALAGLVRLAERADEEDVEGVPPRSSTRSPTTRARPCACSPCSVRAPRSATTSRSTRPTGGS